VWSHADLDDLGLDKGPTQSQNHQALPARQNRPPRPELLPMHHSAQGWFLAFIALLSGFRPAALHADDSIPYARVQSLFQKHCYSCHGIEKPKGKLRIDKLDSDFVKGKDGDHWLVVMDRLEFGDMPPEKEPALRDEDRALMTAWIAQGQRRAELAKSQ